MPGGIKRARPDTLVASCFSPFDVGEEVLALKLTRESKATLLQERDDVSPTGFVSFQRPELSGRGVSGREERLDPITPGLSFHDAAHGQLLGADLKHAGMGETSLVSVRDFQAGALAHPLPRDGVPVRDPMKGRSLSLVEKRHSLPPGLLGDIEPSGLCRRLG